MCKYMDRKISCENEYRDWTNVYKSKNTKAKSKPLEVRGQMKVPLEPYGESGKTSILDF